MRPALLALAVLAAPPAGASDGEVRLEALLHLRATALDGQPGTEVRYDPATRAFRLDGYLVPSGGERHASAYASFRLEGRHLEGALRWALALDTGELRRAREPGTASVCPSATSPTGLDTACGPLVRRYEVPSTGEGPARLTANGRTLDDELRATWLVREASLAWSFGRAGFATLRAGRARYTVADGLVHDDTALGADLALDLGALGPPFEVRAAVFEPTRDWPGGEERRSPLWLLRADWLPSLFEHAGVFLAARRDRAGDVAELFRGAFLEDAVVRLSGLAPGQPGYAATTAYLLRILTAAPAAEASLGWLGVSGSLLPGRGHRLAFTAAVQRGELRRLGTGPAGEPLPDVPLRGRAAWLRWEWSPAGWVTLSPWLLYLSGDRPPTEKHRLGLPAGYAGFLGVTPSMPVTSLFFGGGLAETFAAPRATAPGVNGRGVVAPGLTATFDLPREVTLTGRLAWLRAEDAGPYGGRTYGTEADLDARWPLRPWLALAAEADVLWPGDFFGGRTPISKAILAVDVATP